LSRNPALETRRVYQGFVGAYCSSTSLRAVSLSNCNTPLPFLFYDSGNPIPEPTVASSRIMHPKNCSVLTPVRTVFVAIGMATLRSQCLQGFDFFGPLDFRLLYRITQNLNRLVVSFFLHGVGIAVFSPVGKRVSGRVFPGGLGAID